MQYIKTMDSRNVDELILIDIDAARDSRSLKFEQIQEFTKELYCPLTLGGNIKTLSDIDKALRAGADKVAINSALVDTAFISEAARRFGSQALVAAVDVRLSILNPNHDIPAYRPTVRCGTERLDIDPMAFVVRLINYGIGEVLLTAVHRDGTRIGYDRVLLKKVKEVCDVPLIINGGCNGYADMYEAIKLGADAVAASSVFLFTGITPKNCSFYLDNKGVPARLDA